jgi:hypothetical protein
MSFTYDIRKMTPLLLIFCKHKVIYIFYEIKSVDYTKNWIFLLLKACIVHLYIAFHVSLLLKIHLDPLSFIPLGGINQVPNLVST